MNPTIQFTHLQPNRVFLNQQEFILGDLKNNKIQYSFTQILPFLEALGKEKFGSNFQIFKRNYDTLFKLACYMVKDKLMCQKFGLDPNKGILLTGNSGTGKTTIMKLLPYITPHKVQYSLIPTRKLIFEFNTSGFSIFHSILSTRVYCFDDLGLELTAKHYGEKCELMGEILLNRCDTFDETGILTHATTNLNTDELEHRYGKRVRTRLKRMFNLLTL
ncbi:ATPase [Flavobacteriaceae bacterium]|nr:ATPase [Flavobacteriaceae bacterium]